MFNFDRLNDFEKLISNVEDKKDEQFNTLIEKLDIIIKLLKKENVK